VNIFTPKDRVGSREQKGRATTIVHPMTYHPMIVLVEVVDICLLAKFERWLHSAFR
jgi:hypothetical protein